MLMPSMPRSTSLLETSLKRSMSSIQRAQRRRITLLREISVRREIPKPAAGISEAVIEAKFLRGPKVRFQVSYRSAW